MDCIPGRFLNKTERNKARSPFGFSHPDSYSGVLPELRKGVWTLSSPRMASAYCGTKTLSGSYEVKTSILLYKNCPLLEVGAKYILALGTNHAK